MPPGPVTVLLVDDQSIMLDGLEAVLGNQKSLRVVGRATNGREAVEQAVRLAPDVVLMDISMPEMDGIEATREVLKQCGNTRVLVLSMYNNREFISELLDAGATGYVLKNTSKVELVEALLLVARGERYLGHEVRQVWEAGARTRERDGEQVHQFITKREKEIIRLICAGHTNQEIADRLHISCQTVETHRKSIAYKLDVRNTAGLVKYAMERGWNI